MGCSLRPSLIAFPKLVDVITVKDLDKDHSTGVTNGTCQRHGGGNSRSFPSLPTFTLKISPSEIPDL